ncbi:unnamed protein product [Cylindrotheca closterium]|uniref:Uncharacterized protein n=1 Tax=Cylindrotheca closterium TaxID=2856 RepID=A0AAD2FK03_9STRA|nr:unnamed protein product [Cylindrotheca closterium]
MQINCTIVVPRLKTSNQTVHPVFQNPLTEPIYTRRCKEKRVLWKGKHKQGQGRFKWVQKGPILFAC